MEQNVAKSASAVATLALAAGFIPNLEQVLSSSTSRSSGGMRIREGIGYTLVAENVRKLVGTAIPDQEKVILRVINRMLSAEKSVVSEPEVHEAIVAAHASGELKTRQQPWHIFRYYRSTLKARGAIREVRLAA